MLDSIKDDIPILWLKSKYHKHQVITPGLSIIKYIRRREMLHINPSPLKKAEHLTTYPIPDLSMPYRIQKFIDCFHINNSSMAHYHRL